MKKVTISILLVLGLLLTACGSNGKDDNNDNGEGKMQVITSFTIIRDMAEQVGGELVDVYNLVPSGTDPHEYEPKPNDIKAATDADILFYNGMNLEGGEEGWFLKMMDSVSQDMDLVFELNEGVTPMYLMGGDHEDEVNPHSFISPRVGVLMVNNMTDAFKKVDPDNSEIYDDNSEKYLERLNAVDAKYEETIDAIAEENKILVTSELAFQYMTETYGLREASVWEIDTEELGTTAQLKQLIETLKDEQPPYLFMESNVDPKPLEQVSRESGIPIYEEFIFSDEIGQKGEPVDTYMKFLEHNIRIIGDALGD